jgi:hypothetical protein
MSSKNFCTNLKSELNAWKDSIDNVLEKFGEMHGQAKTDLLGNIEDIRIVAEELNARIAQLDETCSISGFDDIKTERENDLKSIPNVRNIDQAMADVSAGSFGG